MHEPLHPFHHPVLNNPLFRVSNLSYRYPDDTEALSDIHLDIAAGDRIALVGQNGSGKTTLMICPEI